MDLALFSTLFKLSNIFKSDQKLLFHFVLKFFLEDHDSKTLHIHNIYMLCYISICSFISTVFPNKSLALPSFGSSIFTLLINDPQQQIIYFVYIHTY